MSIVQILTSDSFDVVRTKENLIASNVGDLALLTTLTKTSFVAALNELKNDIATLVVSLSLPNQGYLKARNYADNNTVDILKVNASDRIEFSAVDVYNLNIKDGTISGLRAPLDIASGGTGGATASAARTALGLVIGANIQTYSDKLSSIANLAGDNYLPIYTGGVYTAKSVAQTKSFLGLTVGSDVQAYSDKLSQISGLGNMNHVPVFEGSVYTAKTPTETRTFLGLAIGSNVQAYSAKLADIAGLSPATNNMIAWNGTNYVNKTTDEIKALLSLVPGTNIQAYSANLTTLGGLANTTGNVIVGAGGSWTVQAGNSAPFRTTIGLAIGTDVQAYSAVLAQIAGIASSNNYFMVGGASSWQKLAPASARAAMSAASLGSNSDITSLSGLNSISSPGSFAITTGSGGFTVNPGGGTTMQFVRASYDGGTRLRILLSTEAATYNQAEALGGAVKWSGDGTTRALDNTATASDATVQAIIKYLQNLTRDLARTGLLKLGSVT